jgi:mono/diheme cytochrome c family protein
MTETRDLQVDQPETRPHLCFGISQTLHPCGHQMDANLLSQTSVLSQITRNAPMKLLTLLAPFLCLLPIQPALQAADYLRDIQPLFRERCASCHGALKQKGNLRLDAASLIPNASHSEILSRIVSTNEDERMPPEGARLSQAQVALLREWIHAGAPFPAEESVPKSPAEHWAFQPINRSQLPKSQHPNPVDAFLFGDKPAPESAPQSALLRRAHLDLTGTPPTPHEQQIHASVPNLSAVVDDLLSRPQYGERWARHWLDVARYADSNGYERDAEKPFVWRYRDYVIESLNHDKPFNRFVLEQIAGDELPDASVNTHIATGFLRLGHWDDEPADKMTDRYDQLDDIVSTIGQAFLGLTIGCARCHDHKFEPLSTKDYYSLVSIFAPLQRPTKGRSELTTKLNDTDIYAWHEASPKAPLSHILLRGSPTRLGDEVQPAVPAILAKEQPTFPVASETTTRRRLGLAHWIANETNPLTPRVIVNRIWQQHFGEGLVATANDFGLMGATPSHPELLNWLADWFVHDAKWSLKKLHRLLLNSRAWQSVKTQGAIVRYRRLEVEAIRDSMLSVSGQLNPKRFGPAFRPTIQLAAIEANTDKSKVWTPSSEPEASRRSIYAFIKRGLVVPMFETLDLADTVSSCPKRQITTVAPQALTLFNGDFVNAQASHFAARLRNEAGSDKKAQVSLAWRLALCREPNASELSTMEAFLREEPLEQLCRVILNLNEFVYPE